MNLTDRIYLAVHLALTLLVCVRFAHVSNWPWYVVWNLVAIVAIVFASHRRRDSPTWEFAHDWLPGLLFITVFEEVSFLSLALRSSWQNPALVAWEASLFAVPPGEWLRHFTAPWFTEVMNFGYLVFYPLYPAVGGLLWKWRRRPQFSGGFRRLTDSISVGYVVCYAAYLLFPVRSPSHNLELSSAAPLSTTGGMFPALVQLIQSHFGVRGNAFPSAHIMLAFVALVFVFRYLPRLSPWLLVVVLLMCAGAVYDGYHYPLDVLAGGILGLVVGGLGVSFGQDKPSR